MLDRPERYRHAAIAHVFVDGADDAINFYRVAFHAEEIFRVTDQAGRILHGEISIAGQVVMLGDPDPGGLFVDPRSAGGRSVGLHVYVSDVDAVFESALGAGARGVQPPTDMFYGARCAMVEDPFGHVWVLLTQLEDLPPDEIRRRGEQIAGDGVDAATDA